MVLLEEFSNFSLSRYFLENKDAKFKLRVAGLEKSSRKDQDVLGRRQARLDGALSSLV